MSTRAVITFKDEHDEFSVYKHHDGYPDGVMPAITAAKELAWDLPRFEACDFAAAFIAANKRKRGGGIYCTTGPDAHGDLAYHYVVTARGVSLVVEIHDHRGGPASTTTIRWVEHDLGYVVEEGDYE